MDAIFTNIKQTFARANVLTKIIYINLGLFVLLRLTTVFFTLFNLDGFSLLPYVQMPSSASRLFEKPWTIVTYMFTHVDFLHILFNMLWLFWFGKLFLTFFTPRQLGGLYVLGGISGALFFMASYNLFPYYRLMAGYSYLIGASASVMAIVFAVSFYKKELEISLLLIGRIKLIYLALFTLFIDLFTITSANGGGHIAHLGGAALGILFASQISKGKDLTAPINRVLDLLANLRKGKSRKSNLHVSYKRSETDADYHTRKHHQKAALDMILDKLKRSGYASLTAEEKQHLFDASKH